jgi:hypothetical protein
VIVPRRRRLHACAAVLALAVTTVSLIFSTRVAAGSDAYGYVSQVDLWLRGDLHIDQGFGARVPWPLARWTFLPLGYRPEPDGFRIVPQYPPGLPLLMAAAKLAAGQCAMFWVVPLCGGVLVAATYAIGLRIGRPLVGIAAAWIVATSPTVLFMAIAPMSDVPAAAAWAIAVACALGETTAAAAAGGLASAVAILIRPNLVPLAAAVLCWLGWRDRQERRRAPRRATAVAFAATAALGAIVIAVIDARLYGSPLATGYDLTDGFALRYVGTNLRRYGGWLATVETPLACAGLAALAWPSAALWPTRASRRARRLFAWIALVVWAIYLLYVPWDAWWYLRFLLPTFPMMAIGTASIVAALAARAPLAWRRVAAAAVVAALGVEGVLQAAKRDAFDAARGEAKYVEVARVVESLTDPDAVMISADHSGSLRYYAGRLTLRWDTGDPAWLDRTVSWLAGHGHHPYFVLEPREVEALRALAGAGNASARLDWPPLVRFRNGGVAIYDALRRDAGVAAVEQPSGAALRDCPPQKPPPWLR